MLLFRPQSFYQPTAALQPAAAAPPLTTFTLVGTPTTASGPDITIPTGFAAGDLCVVLNTARSAAVAPTAVLPDLFTQLVNNGGVNTRAIISAKILDGAEGALVCMDGDASDRSVTMVFRPDAPISAFAANSINGQATGGDPSVQTIAAAAAASLPIILLGQMYSSGTVDPRSVAPAMIEVVGVVNHFVHYKIYGSADTPLDHTYDMDDEGTANAIQSLYLTFTAA